MPESRGLLGWLEDTTREGGTAMVAFWIVLAGGFVLAMVLIFDPTLTSSPRAESALAAATDSALVSVKPGSPSLQTTTARVGDAEWKILAFYDLGRSAKSNNMFQKDASTGGRFVEVAFEITSSLREPDRIFRQPRLRDERGRFFEHVDSQAFYVPEGKQTLTGTSLPPGVTKEFWAVYEVAADSARFDFEARSMTAFGEPGWLDIGTPAPRKTKTKARGTR